MTMEEEIERLKRELDIEKEDNLSWKKYSQEDREARERLAQNLRMADAIIAAAGEGQG